jgi:hypothetical protein
MLIASSRKSLRIPSDWEDISAILGVIDASKEESLRKSLIQKDYDTLLDAAEDADNDILGLNFGADGIDEAETFRKGIPVLLQTNSNPLAFFPHSAEGLEAALEVYPGRGLVILPKDKSVESLARISEKYGAVVVRNE